MLPTSHQLVTPTRQQLGCAVKQLVQCTPTISASTVTSGSFGDFGFGSGKCYFYYVHRYCTCTCFVDQVKPVKCLDDMERLYVLKDHAEFLPEEKSLVLACSITTDGSLILYKIHITIICLFLRGFREVASGGANKISQPVHATQSM